MAYWHMQLHPNDPDWKREEELLEKLSLIGLGLAAEKQTKDFIKNIKPRDIVLIKRGSEPIALVEVNGELEDNLKNDLSALDWFRYRRKVKVLDIYNKTKLDSSDKPKHDFPSHGGGTLAISKDIGTPTYQYILNWHKSLFPELYQTNDSLKIREVSISNYKRFQNFKIDFTNVNNKPLPIVIVAGINGSGKTTLLEYIKQFTAIVDDSDRSYITLERYDKKLKDIRVEELRFYNFWTIKNESKEESFLSKFFKEKTIYFPTGTDITDLNIFLVKYVKETMYKENLRPSEVFDRIREKIDKVFQDLEILVEFDKVDADGNVFFRNKKDEVFSIDSISTGEKTLLSKVLYLYLKEIKDSVVLIDEPELSLHPAWQNRVLKLYENFAKDNNCQIIIATHSPLIIGNAKNEYIRLLTINDDNQIEVINDVQAYGRDIKWVLEEVMGTEYTREKVILDKFEEVQELINNSNFEEAEEKLNLLEQVIGTDDSMILKLRNDLAFERIDFEADS
jgi:predicted ATP-binding protein involved in virulence